MNMKKHSAFPYNPEDDNPGMTLLDYMAAKAMVALIPLLYHNEFETDETIAKRAYELAAAMIAQKELL